MQFRVIVVRDPESHTHTQTNPQTGPITTHCATKLSVQCNNHEDIYSAFIRAEVIARVQSVHIANVEQRQAATDPQTKPPDLGCESACFTHLSSTTTIAVYCYYLA